MKLTKRLSAALLAVILSLVMLTACTGTLPPDDSGYDTQLTAYRQQVLQLINEVRAEEKANGYDLAPLTGLANQNLNAAAQKRAEELLTRFEHTRPDNSNWSTVLTEYHVGASGDELISSGYETPESLVNGTDGLRFNDKARQDILSNQYSQVGIGYVKKDGQCYWALIFVG